MGATKGTVSQHPRVFGRTLQQAGIVVPNSYPVENQWGGSDAPWHQGGVWRMGMRETQPLVKINIESMDGGESFTGQITYEGEGPIDILARRSDGNNYDFQVTFAGLPFVPEGIWVIGGRDNQRVTSIDVSSSDDGDSLFGTMVYENEGPIGFRANRNGKK